MGNKTEYKDYISMFITVSESIYELIRQYYEIEYTESSFDVKFSDNNYYLTFAQDSILDYQQSQKPNRQMDCLREACNYLFTGIKDMTVESPDIRNFIISSLLLIIDNGLIDEIKNQIEANRDIIVNNPRLLSVLYNVAEIKLYKASFHDIDKNGIITGFELIRILSLVQDDIPQPSPQFKENIYNQIKGILSLSKKNQDRDISGLFKSRSALINFKMVDSLVYEQYTVQDSQNKGLEYLYKSMENTRKARDRFDTYANDNPENILKLEEGKVEAHETLISLILSWYISVVIFQNSIIELLVQTRIRELKGNVKEWLLLYLKRSNSELPSCIRLNSGNTKDSLSLTAYKSIAEVYDCANKIKRLLITDTEKRLMYYTTFETFSYMLPHFHDQLRSNVLEEETQKIIARPEDICLSWSFMNVDYMNDPNEGKAARKFFQVQGKDEEEEEAQNSIHSSDIYLKSFTNNKRDDLPMWEMYGDHAEGIFISVDWPATKKQNAAAPLVYRVLYLSKENSGVSGPFEHEYNSTFSPEEINSLNDQFTNLRKKITGTANRLHQQRMLLATEGIWYLIKDSSYSHESEIRILYDEKHRKRSLKYTGGAVPKVYYPGDFSIVIDEIIFGPKCKNVNEKLLFLTKQFKEINETYGYPSPKFRLSANKYR